MVSFWWLIAAFFAGAMFGIFAMALCSIGDRNEERKWWEDE